MDRRAGPTGSIALDPFFGRQDGLQTSGRNSVQAIPLLRQGGRLDFKAWAQSGPFVARRKSMNRDQEQEDLAQADRHMAELKAHIVRQRLILGRMLAEGRRLLVAKSTLQALEESLRIFGKHCEQILELMRRP